MFLWMRLVIRLKVFAQCHCSTSAFTAFTAFTVQKRCIHRSYVGYASATFLDSKKRNVPPLRKKYVGTSLGLHTESANDFIPQILLIPLFIVGLTSFHQSLGMVTYTLLPIPMSLIHVSFFQKVVSDPKLEGVHDYLRLEKPQNKMVCIHPCM